MLCAAELLFCTDESEKEEAAPSPTRLLFIGHKVDVPHENGQAEKTSYHTLLASTRRGRKRPPSPQKPVSGREAKQELVAPQHGLRYIKQEILYWQTIREKK